MSEAVDWRDPVLCSVAGSPQVKVEVGPSRIRVVDTIRSVCEAEVGDGWRLGRALSTR